MAERSCRGQIRRDVPDDGTGQPERSVQDDRYEIRCGPYVSSPPPPLALHLLPASKHDADDVFACR